MSPNHWFGPPQQNPSWPKSAEAESHSTKRSVNDETHHYVGNGQLRYMDGDGWTDQYKRTDDPYKPIDEPPVRARPSYVNTEPVNRVSPSAAPANKPPGAKKPRRRMSPLVVAVCVGLLALGVGGGLLKPDVFHGATSWAAEQAGQISKYCGKDWA